MANYESSGEKRAHQGKPVEVARGLAGLLVWYDSQLGRGKEGRAWRKQRENMKNIRSGK